jgi:uncharacterized protein YndB with AHSA1/START domain
MKQNITVETTIQKSIELIWKLWTEPDHIKNWNFASDDWHTTHSTNDLQIGGKFCSTMAAKDGSVRFDFWGTYNAIVNHKELKITLGDGRKMEVHFTGNENSCQVVEIFEAETENSIELQQSGWQAILDNFKKYAEAQ